MVVGICSKTLDRRKVDVRALMGHLPKLQLETLFKKVRERKGTRILKIANLDPNQCPLSVVHHVPLPR